MRLNSPRGSLIVDSRTIRSSFSLLSTRDRLLFLAVSVITLSVAFLDLLGVLLIGAVTSLFVTGLGAVQTGNRISILLETLRIEKMGFESQIIILGISASLLFIAKTLISMFLIKRTLFFMARRAAKLSAFLVSKFLSVPISEINRRSAQSSIYALTEGVSQIMIGIVGTAVSLISDLGLLIVLSLGLYIVSPVTAFGSTLLFGLVAMFLYHNMHAKMRSLGEIQVETTIENSQKIFDSISAYRELVVRDRRQFYAREIARLRFRLADLQAEIKFMNIFSKYVLEITLVISSIMLALYLFQSTSAFRAVATLSVFIAASTRILPSILRTQQSLLSLKLAATQAAPTFELIKLFSGSPQSLYPIKSLTRDHSNFTARVSLTNVSFSYPNGEHVLDNINFQVSPGEFIGIVGGTGAGKTTLVDVLLGALAPTSGDVKISGMSPEEAFRKWPGAVAYVSQDCPILQGTIRANLGLGYSIEEIPDDVCWESLRIARLEEFVRDLPKGLDTQIGDRGTNLSGGQRQRLGVARAVITKPRLLILDEATSSLDGITENEISAELKKLTDDITLVVIAHRLSTILDAQRIYYIENGRFRGIGSFDELKLVIPEFATQANLMGL